PNTSAGRLSVLPDSEYQQLTRLFNKTQAGYRKGKLIQQLFEEHVQQSPDAVAIIQADRFLTYAQLNRKANQLARLLIRKGVSPDRKIAVCVPRSINMIVGLLGILKAGGAYVPLDPSYPRERLEYMLAECESNILVSEMSLTDSLVTTAERIYLHADWRDLANEASDNLDPKVLGLRSDHLAYTIYTSGSTGAPKGVMISHRSLQN